MPEPVDRVLRDISAAHSLEGVEAFRRYVVLHREEYSSLDYMKLIDALVDKEEQYAPRCPARISFRIREGDYEYDLTPPEKESVWICMTAQSQGIPQIELWFQTYPMLRENATIIYPTIHRQVSVPPSVQPRNEEEERFVNRREKTSERFRRLGILGEGELQPKPKKELHVETHPEELETMKAFEEMERTLREQQKKESEQEYVVTLSGKEYSAFQKHRKELDALKPYVYHFPGERYEIRIVYSGEAERALIDGVILRVREEGKYTKRKPSPAAHSRWADELCRIFEAETGMPCGVSRYGAIASLVDMIEGYIQEKERQGRELDPALLEKYISEIDLFGRKGQKVYTNEQAKEAFATFVRNVESSGLGGEEMLSARRGHEPDICEPDVIYPTFVDVYVYLEKLRIHKATDDDRKKSDRAMELLTKCGYSSSRYGEYLRDAKAYFEDKGIRWEDVTGGL